MAYAGRYTYDLFVSYAAVDDDEPDADKDAGWVTQFVRHLEVALAKRLGGRERLKIYFDRRSLASNHELRKLTEAASQSALFLAIASPGYVMRDWTQRELEAFVTSTSERDRLFIVDYLPLDANQSYPDALTGRKRIKFWAADKFGSNTPMPLGAKDPVFAARIHDVAEHARQQLITINAAETVRPTIRRAAEAIADDTARRRKGVIYLAQTTDDLEEERLQVKRYLEQFGFSLLPAVDLPGGGEAFAAAAEADIRQADLYVHLLGPRAGRYPADVPEGYGATQMRIAKTLGKRLLLWRHPQLDMKGVGDERQKNLLNDAAVEAIGLQGFMDEIRRRMEASAKPAAQAKRTSTLVFIDANETDYDVAKIVQQEFSTRDMSTVIPLYAGSAEDVIADVTESMRDCDVLVFIYGKAPPNWVRAQMRLFSKLRPGARTRLVAIFVGPPDEKPADIGFSLPDLRRVDFPGGWSPAPMHELIRELEQ